MKKLLIILAIISAIPTTAQKLGGNIDFVGCDVYFSIWYPGEVPGVDYFIYYSSVSNPLMNGIQLPIVGNAYQLKLKSYMQNIWEYRNGTLIYHIVPLTNTAFKLKIKKKSTLQISGTNNLIELHVSGGLAPYTLNQMKFKNPVITQNNYIIEDSAGCIIQN